MPGKVLARILLDRVRQKLLTHQRHEQSGFTPKKSTVDRILALRVLTERLRDFRIGLLAAYVDLRNQKISVASEEVDQKYAITFDLRVCMKGVCII